MHRLIYIASHTLSAQTNWLLHVENSLKTANEDRWEEPIAGIGLFYKEHFINVVEGSERMINKHLNIFNNEIKYLGKTLKDFKILFIVYHINKRHFMGWVGLTVTPPVLLNKIGESDQPQKHGELLQQCVFKLYKIAEYLSDHHGANYRKAAENLSSSCKQHFPETDLLDFLLGSPLLVSVDRYLQNQAASPQGLVFQEEVWPPPTDFVPYNIVVNERRAVSEVDDGKNTDTDEEEENGLL